MSASGYEKSRTFGPNARAKGRGRTKLGETGQRVTPRPLERRVGRRTGKEWLLLFAFRSWLLTYGGIHSKPLLCALPRSKPSSDLFAHLYTPTINQAFYF